MNKEVRAWLIIAALQLAWIGPCVYDATTKEPVDNELIYEYEDVLRFRIDAETDIEPPEVEVKPVDKIVVEDAEKKSLGVFKITAYCPCEDCSGNWGHQTSIGTYATQRRTIAVDPSVIPYGTVVVINGHKYIAEDCGGAIKGNDIDIFFDSHEEAKEFGVQYAEVFICQ